MIVIVKHISESKICDLIFDVSPSDTVESLKGKIQQVVGHPMEFSSNQWRLYPSIQTMDDDSRTLSEYLPKDELELTLLRSGSGAQYHQKPADKDPDKTGSRQTLALMKITFRTLTGKAFTFDLEPTDTILSIKVLLQNWVEIQPMDQCLWFAGKPLEVGQTLSDYNVHDGSTILVKNFDDP